MTARPTASTAGGPFRRSFSSIAAMSAHSPTATA
jgi:hypothetical protein